MSEDEYFHHLFDVAKAGVVCDQLGGKPAVAFLVKSGLDRDVLRTIWSLSIATPQDHSLDYNGFCRAVRYVGLAQHGHHLAVI